MSIFRKKTAAAQQDALSEGAPSEKMSRGTQKFFVQNVVSRNSERASFARQRIAEIDPATGIFLAHIGQLDVPPGPSIAWTDGTQNYYAPGFLELTRKEQVGVEMHEDAHVMLRHPQRAYTLRQARGPMFDHQLWNIVCDGIINTTIIQAKASAKGHDTPLSLPNGAIYLPDILKSAFNEDWDAKEALDAFTAEMLYFAIKANDPPKEKKSSKPKPGQGQGQPQKGQGQGKPQKGKGQGQPGEGEGEGEPDPSQGPMDGQGPAAQRVKEMAGSKGWKQDMVEAEQVDQAKEEKAASDWRSRIDMAGKMAGKDSFNLMRHIGKDGRSSSTNWRTILRSVAVHALAQAPRRDWTRPSRKYIAVHQEAARQGLNLIYEPATVYLNPVCRLGVVYDTSGSIDDEVLKIFNAELEVIRRVTGAALEVVTADDRVQFSKTFEPGTTTEELSQIKAIGQGGTDFSPALKFLDEKKVQCVIYLTDLCGPASYRPKFTKKVIWAVPERFGMVDKAPFGQFLPIQG